MATITYDGNTPGRGGTRQLWAEGGRPMKVVTGTFAFDSSYASGGEDISGIFNEFKGIGTTSGLLGVLFQANASKSFPVDYDAQKVACYITATGIEGSGDLSAIDDVRFFAWGYIK